MAMRPCDEKGTGPGYLSAGEVGYMIAGIKKLSNARIGDTSTEKNRPTEKAFSAFKEAKPMVFCGMFPAGESGIEDLRDALEKLRLNDASFHYESENSPALGRGFRGGFLGLLHREIIQERLEREFNLNLITTAPSVSLRITEKDGQVMEIHNPSPRAMPPSGSGGKARDCEGIGQALPKKCFSRAPWR